MGALLLGPLRENILLFKGIFVRVSRNVKMPCKQVSLPVEALLTNLDGVCLPGLVRE
jgi:hypothetical protein